MNEFVNLGFFQLTCDESSVFCSQFFRRCSVRFPFVFCLACVDVVIARCTNIVLNVANLDQSCDQ